MKLHNPIEDTKISTPLMLSLIIVIFAMLAALVIGVVMLSKVLGPITVLVLFFLIAAFGPVYYVFTGKDPYKK